MADRYLLESGTPDGYLLEDGSGVLLLEDGSTGKIKAAYFAADVAMTGDANRVRASYFAVDVASPLEERIRTAYFAVDVAMTGDEDRSRVSYFAVDVAHTGDGEAGTPPVPAECVCGPGTWLLDLVVGGRVFRYSTRQLQVSDARGNAYLYQAGLTDFDLQLDGLLDSHGFEVTDRRVSWPALKQSLTFARATLRHILDDQVLEEALLILEGSVDEPEYGDPDAPASLVGTIQVDEADRMWPDPRAVVDADTWVNNILSSPYIDDQVIGAVYPTVFGYPGLTDDGTTSPATPALMVEFNLGIPDNLAHLLIAEGVVDAVGQVVRVFTTAEGGGQDDYTVQEETDLLGRKVAYVEINDADAIVHPIPGEEYYVAWSVGGGTAVPDRSGPVRSLTDVALFVGRLGGRRFDFQAQEAQRQVLDQFHVDGMLNVDALELVPWFEQTLMPLFPIFRTRTRTGMYWRFVDYGAGPTDAIAHIDAEDGRARRASSIRTPVEQVKNRFTIHYGWDIRSGNFSLRRTMTDQAQASVLWYLSPDLLEVQRVIGSPICASSLAEFGPREASPVETKFLWSTATATSVLAHWAKRDAFPRQLVWYTWEQREARELVAGDVVTVTDSEVLFDREVAIVKSIRLSSHRLAEVELEVLDRRVRG